jgi:hypothetical protein
LIDWRTPVQFDFELIENIDGKENGVAKANGHIKTESCVGSAYIWAIYKIQRKPCSE